MSYSWFKNGRMIVKSVGMERQNIFGITQEYYDDYIVSQKNFEGSLTLYKSNITSLGNLESVGGDLTLYKSNVTSLGNLKVVEGWLGLSRSKITSLGKLEYVGDNIYCTRNSNTHKMTLDSKFKNQVRIY